ncbi:MAG: YegP family protein [Kiritimatiellae bacterium]|nr:YegP family protein [Kiritimatiellia bacterium]
MGTFAVKQVKNGIMFNLKATNGQVVATSEIYTTKRACENGIASVRKNAAIAPIEDQTAETVEKQKNPKFEIFTDKAGEFRFRLKAANGEIIAASQGYASMKSCLAGIESVKKNAPESPIVEEEAPKA